MDSMGMRTSLPKTTIRFASIDRSIGRWGGGEVSSARLVLGWSSFHIDIGRSLA